MTREEWIKKIMSWEGCTRELAEAKLEKYEQIGREILNER